MNNYNNISIRPIYKFVVWLFFGFLIFAYGVSHPLAAAANINGTIYSSDISLSAQAQWYDTNHNSIETYTANNSNVSTSSFYRAVGRMTSYLSFNLYTNLSTNVLYSLTVFVNNDTDGNVQNWNNLISTGTYTGGANSNNSNGTCRVEIYSIKDSYNIKYAINMSTPNASENVLTTGAYYITFRPTCDGNYINIPVSFSTSSTNMYFFGYHLETLGLTDGLSSSDIENILNNSGLATAKSVNDVKTSVNEVKQEMNGINDSINNDNTDGASSEASDFFNSFTTDTFGLTSIITAPLNLIQSLTSKTCSPLHLPLPFLDNKYLDLPCMSTIYSQYFGSFFTLYQTITYGIIAYWVCVGRAEFGGVEYVIMLLLPCLLQGESLLKSSRLR